MWRFVNGGNSPKIQVDYVVAAQGFDLNLVDFVGVHARLGLAGSLVVDRDVIDADGVDQAAAVSRR